MSTDNLVSDFVSSDAYCHFAEALRDILSRRALDLLPEAERSEQTLDTRYHLEDVAEPDPEGCWCTGGQNSAPRCPSREQCRARPRHVVGEDGGIRICRKDHGPDMRGTCWDCFNIGSSSQLWLQDICLLQQRSPAQTFIPDCVQEEVRARLEPYGYSEEVTNSYVNIICIVIEHLYSPGGSLSGVWDPEIQGLIGWDGVFVDECVEVLMLEVDAVQIKHGLLDEDPFSIHQRP